MDTKQTYFKGKNNKVYMGYKCFRCGKRIYNEVHTFNGTIYCSRCCSVIVAWKSKSLDHVG